MLSTLCEISVFRRGNEPAQGWHGAWESDDLWPSNEGAWLMDDADCADNAWRRTRIVLDTHGSVASSHTEHSSPEDVEVNTSAVIRNAHLWLHHASLISNFASLVLNLSCPRVSGAVRSIRTNVHFASAWQRGHRKCVWPFCTDGQVAIQFDCRHVATKVKQSVTLI